MHRGERWERIRYAKEDEKSMKERKERKRVTYVLGIIGRFGGSQVLGVRCKEACVRACVRMCESPLRKVQKPRRTRWDRNHDDVRVDLRVQGRGLRREVV